MTEPARRRSHGLRDLEEFSARMTQLRQELQPPTTVGDYLAYTDGACFGNPDGPGGWAAAVYPPADGEPWLLWGHLSSTTNNRAEALGLLGALEWAPPGSRLVVRSDSELTVRIFGGHYKARANPEIWEIIRRTITEKRLSVTTEWLRAHVGDPGNELADRLSKLGARNGTLDLLDMVVPAVARDEEPAELVGLEPRTDWEREFLRSLAGQLRAGRTLSPKQQAIVDRMRAPGASGKPPG